MKFQIYSRVTFRGRRWYWRLKARNGEIIAHGEAYNRKADCLRAVELVKDTGPQTTMEDFN